MRKQARFWQIRATQKKMSRKKAHLTKIVNHERYLLRSDN